MRSRLACFACLLLACLLASCSLSGIDRPSLPRCSSDTECDDLNATVLDPCQAYVCAPESRRCELAPLDRDHDGDPPTTCGGSDCADEDPARFGAATEICNGIDDDCNGSWDGPDEDDDGDQSIDLCAGPAIADDCDDTDPFVSFGEPEHCDGIDNDCLIDGVARQGGGRRLEPGEDVDGDLHAAIEATCVAGPTADARFFPLDDCDDTRADVFPGATERCDGVDNDCDGTPDDAAGSTEPGTACRASRLLAGGDDTCVVSGDGELVCWGDNRLGQLGDLAAAADAAIVVGAAAGLTDIQIGASGGCGIHADGGVTCWGSSHFFERGRTPSATAHAPARIPGVTDAVELSVGNAHACVRTSAGTLTCWGFACPGTAVNGATADCGGAQPPVENVAGIDDAVEIDAGGLMTCARRASGQVWCWGFNPIGRIGTGLSETDAPAAPVLGIDDAVQVATGGAFACAVRASGELWCWGQNEGCVGPACEPMIATPRAVPLDGTLADVRLGGRHGCVLYDDGRFGCWGDNESDQLAIVDPSIDGLVAPRTASVTDVLEIATGASHTCVRRADGMRCWGENGSGQLGDGRTTTAAGPFAGFLGVPVSVTANVMQIALGPSGTCFRLPDLRVVCVGFNPFGELGSASFPFGVPSATFGEAPVIDLDVGFARAMVVRRDGRVSTYGDARYASAGTADADGYLVGVDDAVDAACGDYHSCFVRESGAVGCIGIVTDGALGDGTAGPETCSYARCARSPVTATGIDDAIAVSAGAAHTCVVTRPGAVMCWGRNDRGQTGTLPLGSTSIPTEVEGLPSGDPAVGIALADSSSCAVLESGAVWCWGQGFGPLASSFSVDPLPVVEAANVAQIAATDGGICVRQRSGVVRCMGANGAGQLGDGTTTDAATLRTVLGVTDARDVSCGPAHCCATRRGGQTVCWGDNSGSRLANGDTVNRSTATSVASMLWSLD